MIEASSSIQPILHSRRAKTPCETKQICQAGETLTSTQRRPSQIRWEEYPLKGASRPCVQWWWRQRAKARSRQSEENAKEHYVVAGMEQSTGGGQSSQDVFAVSEVPWVFLTIIPIYSEGHVC